MQESEHYAIFRAFMKNNNKERSIADFLILGLKNLLFIIYCQRRSQIALMVLDFENCLDPPSFDRVSASSIADQPSRKCKLMRLNTKIDSACIVSGTERGSLLVGTLSLLVWFVKVVLL